MNPVVDLILCRKSVRAYEDRPVPDEVKEQILHAAMRAPTAGNMMVYSIVDVKDQAIKDTLAVTCDNQPFIARAPLVLLFLADYQRWYDYFIQSGVEALCETRGEPLRKPEEGDLFLACCDALIAAQTAVIAAESFGLGSCYIGDIMENYEKHRELFGLPQYAFPICLVCFGYPTAGQQARPLTSRFGKQFIVAEDRYHRLDRDELTEMFRELEERSARVTERPPDIRNAGQAMYARKFASDFSKEMSRSARAMLRAWLGE